jgi:integrase
MLDRAARKRLISHNPATGLRPLEQSKLAAHERRLPFTLQQLAQFFKCEFYRKCGDERSLVYAKSGNMWRFWMPLICVFIGMRPREIAQIEVADIKQTKAGTWYIDIAVSPESDEGEDTGGGHKVKKSVKTVTSKRQIPIHPELTLIGFWEFVEKRRESAKQDPYLLPGLKPDKYGNRAAYALRRFNESYLPQAIALEERQSFYSFRHSFRDALRRCKAPSDTLQALGGWSQSPTGKDEKVVSDDYGNKADPDIQKEWIAKISYHDLDLSHLRNQQSKSK